MQSSSLLSVDMGAIWHNLSLLTEACEHVMVMVKANAYGTDALFLSQFLQRAQLKGIPFLGVSHVWEGVSLREAGITLPIFVISVPPHDADAAAYYDLTCAVSTLEEVQALDSTGKKHGKVIDVHLQLDTGMHRFGATIQEGYRLFQQIQKTSHIHFDGVMTHFVASDSPKFDPFSEQQIQLFQYFLRMLPVKPNWVHAANSAAAVRFSLPFCNLARIGLGFLGYGACFKDARPALNLTTSLASIRRIKKGESVGYYRSFVFEKEKGCIGVIPFGYFDGFSYNLSGKGYVLIHEKKAPIIGNICMDFMMIDLTEIPEAEVGDEAVLFGTSLTPQSVADQMETDIRELLARIPSRVERTWLNVPCLTYL
jgi:Alr-MurF fusion protein